MPGKSSSTRIDYSLRPAKNLERKLVFDCLLQLPIDLSSHRYIGLGSLWFVDLSMAHQLLGIDELISIEMHLAERADFNRPFGCIHVVRGDSTSVLPTLDIDQKQTLIWLDYDSPATVGPALEDLAFIVSNAVSGSIFLITVNAHVAQLDNRWDPASVQETRKAVLEERVGLLLPEELPKKLNKTSFPGVLGEIFSNSIRRNLRQSGSSLEFLPLINIEYSDGTPMVTFGGILCETELASQVLESHSVDSKLFRAAQEGDQLKLHAPVLTTRERRALDRILPRPEDRPAEELLQDHQIPIEVDDFMSYAEFYRHLPHYAELILF